MIKPNRDTEKELEQMYKEVQKSGFIDSNSLKRKYEIEKIKKLEDLQIKNLDKISPKKLEALQYLLLRLRNQGFDYGYGKWMQTYDVKWLEKSLRFEPNDLDKNTRLILEVTRQLVKEIKLEMQDANVEPTYFNSMLNRLAPPTAVRTNTATETSIFEFPPSNHRGLYPNPLSTVDWLAIILLFINVALWYSLGTTGLTSVSKTSLSFMVIILILITIKKLSLFYIPE